MYPIWKYASEEVKRKWLPKLASGESLGCFGLTEPDFGSNPSGMLTTAVRTGSGYRITGTKRWHASEGVVPAAIGRGLQDGCTCFVGATLQ